MKTLLLLLMFAAVPALGQELTIAVAADVRPAMEQIASRFKATSGIKLRISYGSSGNFYQQLQNGAPFDVFLSANVEYAKKLELAGLIVPETNQEYARGTLVLMVPEDSKADLTEGLHLLLTPAVKKVAIADPNHAPYGQAAIAALKSGGVYDWALPKLVMGENVSQATSFVLSGAAEAGLVAKSLALTPAAEKKVKIVEVPAKLYPPLLQAMVVMKSSRNQNAAQRFEEFMRSDEVKSILKQYGFGIPGE